MSKNIIVIALMGVFLFCGAFQVQAGDNAKSFKPYKVTVVAKSSSTPGVYDCNVVVKDAKTDKEVFAPEISAKIDSRSQASTITEEDLTFTCTVVIDKTGKEATYTFEAKQGDKEIQKDEGKVPIK